MEGLMQKIFRAKMVKFSNIFIHRDGDFKNILNIA